MSGLDGLGWPNPEDEPKPKKTMNSQLEIKLAPTPESDKAKIAFTSLFANDDAYWIPYVIGIKLERERDELREWTSVNGVSSLAKDRDQFRARLREEQQLHAQTLDERDEAREEAADWKTEYEIVVDRLRGRKHPRDNGIIADDEIIPKLERERDEAREHVANLEVSLTAAIRSANVCQAAAEKATARKERLANAIRNAAGVLSCENVDVEARRE